MPYKFFLSYSRMDATGGTFLSDFFRRLEIEVAQAAGLSAADLKKGVGFFDQLGIEPGDKWPAKLDEALGTSDVLICLYSNSYFNSPACGKEFEVFRSRVRSYTPPPGAPQPRLIIPVLWDLPTRLPEKLPDAVADLQYKHAAFGDEYADEGVAYQYKQDRKAVINRVITNLANLIVGATDDLPPDDKNERHLPPAEVKPYGEVQSAFHALTPPPAAAAAATNALPPDAPPPSFKGPAVAWYVYLAGRRADYEGVRTYRDCYGVGGGHEWQPHLPPRGGPVWSIMPVVGEEKMPLMPNVVPLSQRLITYLKEAEDTNTVTVLVVDPWSVKFQSFRSLLNAYDALRLANCEIVIVWNDADGETPARRAELTNDLTQNLWRSLGTPEDISRVSAVTVEGFQEKVRSAVASAQRRLNLRSKAARSVPSNGGESLPRVSGNL